MKHLQGQVTNFWEHGNQPSLFSKCEEELLVSQEGLAQRNCAENLLYRILPKLANNYVKCGYKLLYTLKYSSHCTFFTKIKLS